MAVVLFTAVAGAGIAWWWTTSRNVPTGAVAPPPSVSAAPTVAPSVAATAPAASSPAVAEPDPPPAPLDAAGLSGALTTLLGRDAVLRFLQLGDLPRHVAATVDNLARDQAPSAVWPVLPTPGHFTVMEQDGRTVIDPDNELRYAPFVQWIEHLDAVRLAALYRSALPLLQQAYEQLGFPQHRFHDRLVQVMDHLLATPVLRAPLEVRLTEVQGPYPSERPWVRYEFADPAPAAGQAARVPPGAGDARRAALTACR
jgi:hypothetical protein